MNPQFSQDYNVDERYKGVRKQPHTVDNVRGMNFYGNMLINYVEVTGLDLLKVNKLLFQY